MSVPLLKTKLHLPHLRPHLVSRAHLLNRLNENLVYTGEFTRRLTLIAAPAGYGKTTLVTEWLCDRNQPVAWLSLDESDNDPTRFLTYFIAALQQIQEELGQSASAMLQSLQTLPVEIILTTLINEIESLPHPFILTLDDYHTIRTPAIHQHLAFILDHQPTQMHLVLTTREDPLLPIARLRAQQQVLEIRQQDLRFTTGEITHFLRQVMNLSLSSDEIAALERRTEGWIAGLQLAALSMQGRRDLKGFIQAFTGSSRYILDYLIEEVFAQQSEGVQDFLVKTSILDRLSGP
ncbi:MAG TPA: AAA family ATPase, partial [Anaerolineales bacterium]|nr:AAA family ATPase [Anaerolineales bacterium]